MSVNYITFLRWLFLIVVTSFGVIALNHYGYLTIVFTNDPTGITWLISAIFVLMTLYCGARAYTVSHELAIINQLKELNSRFRFSQTKDSLVDNHADDLATIQKHATLSNYNQSTLLNYRASKYHDKHEIVWHVADGLVSLGLVGTVIGFIIALWPFFNIDEFTFDVVRGLLGDISGGIAIALFTTLAGLVTSVILRIQAQFLETATNTLISELAHFSETNIIPSLIRDRENDQPQELYERYDN